MNPAMHATQGVDSAPRHNSERVNFFWFLLFFFLQNFGQGVFPPLLPQIMEGLSLSFASAGLLGASFGAARFVVDLPAGILVERLSIARVFHGGLGLAFLGTCLSAMAESFFMMLLGRALVGLGSGMSVVVGIVYLMRQAPADQRIRWGNLYEVAVIGGMAISAHLSGMVAAWRSWRWSFVMAATVLSLAWGVAALRVVPAIQGVLDDQGPSPAETSKRVHVSVGAEVATIFLMSFGLAFVWGGGISTLLPLYGGSELMLSPEVIGRTMAIAFAIEVCLLFPAGWASDVLGKVSVLIPGYLVMMVGTILVPFAGGVFAYTVAFTLVVAGMSVWMIPPALLAERMPRGFRGKSAGLYRLVTDLGMITGPGMVGVLIERWGFRMGLAALAAVLALSACLSATLLPWFTARRGTERVGRGERTEERRERG
jgi:MFS family permease